MSKITVLAIVIMLIGTGPALSMNNYDDPRILISYMDKSLTPERDILRVTVKATPDNKLVFEVNTRGEQVNAQTGEYILLHITHGSAYALLIPIGQVDDSQVLMYEQVPQSESNRSGLSKEFRELSLQAGFQLARINKGMKFSIPLDWIDFSHDLGYDAYSVQAKIKGNTLLIDTVYDQAGKGRKIAKQFSAITLLNRLCATRRK